MLSHLPEAIFWDVLRRTDDIKTCVAIWSSSQDIYSRYSKPNFWKNLCYYNFQISSNPYNMLWNDIYWWMHRNTKGCGYCNKTMTSPNDGYGTPENHDCIQITSLNIFVCKQCKTLLGDNMIHKNDIDPWKTSLMRRLRGNRYSNIFNNYFGEKQIEKCFGYNLKCSECLKNVKNLRCNKHKCGSCCKCKYHKSHYDDASPGDIIVSFDIYRLISTSLLLNDNVSHRKKRNTKKTYYVYKF
jgi:hypothetical protein